MATPVEKDHRNRFCNWFLKDRDEDETDFKNNMLVVATLIVAVTFQTGVSPPGGAWQDTQKGNEGHDAGKAILSSLKFEYHLFLILNTLAFSTSIQLILFLLFKSKFYFEVFLATFSMVGTYGTAIWSLSPDEYVKFRLVFLAAFSPYVLRLLQQLIKWFLSRK